MSLLNFQLVTEKFLENILSMLNEPSVGLYRVQEHVRRSTPQLVEKKVLEGPLSIIIIIMHVGKSQNS